VALFAALAVLGLRQDLRPARARYARAAAWLAGCSYSLYLSTSRYCSSSAWSSSPAGAAPWTPSLGTAALAGAIALAVLAYAFALSRLTEARTPPSAGWRSPR
jgi:peptidoglycan/LPS O-acetylase OafA/YrhL